MNSNIKNRTIFLGDNLDFLRGINSECVDLIYADPPFNKKRNSLRRLARPPRARIFWIYSQRKTLKMNG